MAQRVLESLDFADPKPQEVMCKLAYIKGQFELMKELTEKDDE